MEKNTIIAVVLSVIVITIGMTLQATFYPVQPVATTEAANTDQGDATVNATSLSTSTNVVVPSNLAYGSGVNGSFMPINDKDADSTPLRIRRGCLPSRLIPKELLFLPLS